MISVISVALVLVVLGVVALIDVSVHRVGQRIRADIGFVAVVDEMATDSTTQALERQLKSAPFTASATYVSAEDVNKRWMDELGDEELLDINPFQPEWDVKVKSGWANADSLEAIAKRLTATDGVYDVKIHTDIARNVNLAIHSLMMVLVVIAGALLLISFVLINNTVRMDIYAQRMVIHTMQYVGATRSFIRRPYIIRCMVSGLIAAVVAAVLLTALLLALRTLSPSVDQSLTLADVAMVYGGLVVVGVTVCGAASLLATTKYLRKSYDEIYNS